jgi:glutamyl-tRNA reductase
MDNQRKPPAGTGRCASDERVVMIGAGYWAQFQVEGWRDAGSPLVAIANRNPANAEPLARRYGVPKCYADVATMLDAEQPTLVDVVLPPVAQEPAVRAAGARHPDHLSKAVWTRFETGRNDDRHG